MNARQRRSLKRATASVQVGDVALLRTGRSDRLGRYPVSAVWPDIARIGVLGVSDFGRNVRTTTIGFGRAVRFESPPFVAFIEPRDTTYEQLRASAVLCEGPHLPLYRGELGTLNT